VKEYRKPERIGSVVDSLLADKGYLAVCREYDVVRSWPSIAGPRLAEVTECTRAEDGVLFVRVPSASWRQEISFLKSRLIRKIRMSTSCSTIRDIVFY